MAVLIQNILIKRKSIEISSNRIATHFIPEEGWTNSYPQIGQTFASSSVSIAHEGHSFFIDVDLILFVPLFARHPLSEFRSHLLADVHFFGYFWFKEHPDFSIVRFKLLDGADVRDELSV